MTDNERLIKYCEENIKYCEERKKEVDGDYNKGFLEGSKQAHEKLKMLIEEIIIKKGKDLR